MQFGSGWIIPTIAALALLSSPLSAKDPEPETTVIELGDDERPLAGWDPQHVVAYFTQVATSPEVDAQLAPMIEEVFELGEPVPGWNELGIDVLSELDRREGGLAGNLLRDGDNLPKVTDLSGTVAPDLSGFSMLVLRADPPGGVNERSFLGFTPGMWLEIAAQRRLRGTAHCYTGLVGLTLHSRQPITELSMGDLLTAIIGVSLNERLASRDYCIAYERAGDGYRTRAFLPDGRSLPQLDSPGKLSIMPSSEFESYIETSVMAEQPE
jgi:hypothetical protein